MLRFLVLCSVAVLLCNEGAGTSIGPAVEQIIPSADGKFAFLVVPKLRSNREEELRKREGTDPDLPLLHGSPHYCYGTLFEGGMGSYRPVWRAKLVNEIAPAQVLISNGGRFVVTINNWGQGGYGDIVAIYGEKGKFIRKFAVEEIFSADEIEFLDRKDPANPIPGGYRLWLSKARFDMAGNILILELRTHRDARIDLASGTLIKNVE